MSWPPSVRDIELRTHVPVYPGQRVIFELAITAERETKVDHVDVHVELDAWRELARELGGRLVIGDLSIDGRLDQLDVAVALRWDDAQRPSAIAANVGPAAGVADIDLTLAQPSADGEAEPAAEPIRALLARWPADFIDLRIADGIASAAWRLGEGPADAARVRELVMALRGLLAALDPSAGPYR